jgi:hypothetical protein
MAQAFPNTPKSGEVVVTLKGGPAHKPYNQFKVKPDGKGNMTLADPYCLGLNKAWLQPPKTATAQEKKEFPYWGHEIYKHIKDFNASSSDKRRVFVYDLRHGEADHNRWKGLKGKEWSKVPTIMMYPSPNQMLTRTGP